MGTTHSFVHGTPGSDRDFLVYKLDLHGSTLWRKNFGGVYDEIPRYLFQDGDDNYVVSGETSSFVVGVPGLDWDLVAYKIDTHGNKLWRKHFGGDRIEGGLVKMGSDGYFVLGSTLSYVHGSPGVDTDMLIYKIDASGRKLWRKNLGGVEPETCDPDLRVTSDGGYLITGTTSSFVHGTPGTDQDFLIYHLDTDGTKRWRRNFGGTEWEDTVSGNYDDNLVGLESGDLLLWGTTWSRVTGTMGYPDMAVFRLDSNGRKKWRKHFGGVERETLHRVFVVE
jgi:hypothetical protein